MSVGRSLAPCVALAASLLAAPAPAQTPAPVSEARIRVYYDDLRVAHVFAADDAGVFRGLGYTQVRDFPIATLSNLWSATGRFAEVAGELALVRDERFRQWGFDRRAAELASDPAELDPLVRAWLGAYVDGVNAARRAWLEHPARIDALAGEDGAELGFDPVPPWLHPQRVKEDHRARLQRLFEGEIALEHVLAYGLALAAGPDFGGAGYTTFTNVFLMRGSERDPHTRFLADVHQPLQEFGYRSYLVQLAGPRYDLIGNTVPGFPCIVLGASRNLAFGSMTLPKKPRELAMAGLPFRIDDRSPLARSAWSARLEPDEPARFQRGAERVPLLERAVTLRTWDVGKKALVDDPRGPLTLRWVHEASGLDLPVVEPGPRESLDLAARPTIRFEARSFLGQRSLWETWMRLGLCARVGAEEGGIDAVLAREGLATGRGQIVLACDAEGGFEFLWSARAPILGEKALARWRAGEELLDGHDPEQTWRGFHGFAELPRGLERSRRGERPAAWLECNSSPEHMSPTLAGFRFAGPPTIYDGQSWPSRRQERAHELFERAAADGVLATRELDELALDVQDQWSRANWPRLRALALLSDPPLSARARAFLEWIELFRCEGPDGKPGAEEFLAHPLSQVLPFLVLLRDRYEDALIAARAPAEALALAFDPALERSAPEPFLTDARFAANRAALAAALEWAAELRELTLAHRPGGLVNAEYFRRLAEETKDCARLFPSPCGEPVYVQQASEWGSSAPPVALRWGQVNLYALTPHRGSFEPSLSNARLADLWLSSIFAPCSMELPLPYYTKQPAVVFPVGGTHDSLFMVHREGFSSYAKALVPRGEGFLALAPIDFGSQVLFQAELVPGARPRVRVLAALAGTEITVELPENGTRARDLFLPTARFARGEWSELATDEDALRANADVRVLVLE